MNYKDLYLISNTQKNYYDRRSKLSKDEYFENLEKSNTLYIGNLSKQSSYELLYEIFSLIAPVKKLIMGVNKQTLDPCGFAFVEYETHEYALRCIDLLTGFKINDSIISIDLDWGYVDGREYGRGYRGGQVNEEKEKFVNNRGRNDDNHAKKQIKH